MLRRTAAALGAAVASCALVAGPTASAHADTTSTSGINTAVPSGTGCVDRTLYTPFTFVGDTNPYFLVNGGDFEGSTSSWFGSGVQRAYENEPWQVGGDYDDTSAQLTRTGATLSAPAMCVRDDEPTLRFFYKSPGVAGAKLTVKLRTTSLYGSQTQYVTIDGSTPGWAVSDAITIHDNTDSSGTQRLSLDFTSNGGAWNIDDVYVDPWKWVIK